MPPGHARIWLRFTPEEIYRLAPFLNLYGVAFRHRYQADPLTAFCIVCARLSFPNRWEHLVDLFGKSKSWLSTVFNDIMLYLIARYHEVLLYSSQLTYEQLQVYKEAIYQVNGVPGVWGFINSTFRGYCHPTGNEAQRRVYFGYKKQHSNNY